MARGKIRQQTKQILRQQAASSILKYAGTVNEKDCKLSWPYMIFLLHVFVKYFMLHFLSYFFSIFSNIDPYYFMSYNWFFLQVLLPLTLTY